MGYWSTLTRDGCVLLGSRSGFVLVWSHQYRLATSSDVVRAGRHVSRGVPMVKPWTSLDEQVSILVQRGLTDAPEYRDLIERTGYYRLSGFAYPFGL